MKEELDKKGNSFILPFIVGGVVGAGIAFLFAPKSGREIRKDIKEYAVQTGNMISRTVDEGKKIYEGGRAAVTTAIDAGRKAFLEEKELHRLAA